MESVIRSESLPIPLILEGRLAGRSKFSLNSSALSSLPSGSPFLHIISIAGSQSSGKSTLANHAFSLNFPTTASSYTGQTTHGVDLQLTDRYACLDIEGSDSAERDAEDNSYISRMIGAFGLVVSNLLIYNINIRDIRKRHEVDSIANMMTHYLRICNEKRIILFCIRDVVERFHNLKEIRDNISHTFKEAWNKAKVESNNQTFTDDLESVFEMDLITCSKYEEAERRFENEKIVMRRFRDKVEEKLQNVNQFEVKSLKTLWNETWNRIDRNEMTEFRQLVVKEAWEVLRQKLNRICFSLASEMPSSRDYKDQLNEYYTQISNEIRVNYAHDEYAKQALLTFYRQESAKPAVYLEVEHFKISINNYFYSESEHTNNLYADLISIYQKIDRDDSNRDRINKSAYKKFLHKLAEDHNLYVNNIKQSLNSIYSISHKRINQYLAQLNDADITEINLKTDLSIMLCGLGGFLATASRPAMINGDGLLGMENIGAAREEWKRDTVLKGMATEVRRSIINNDAFQNTYQNLIDMLRISDCPSS